MTSTIFRGRRDGWPYRLTIVAIGVATLTAGPPAAAQPASRPADGSSSASPGEISANGLPQATTSAGELKPVIVTGNPLRTTEFATPSAAVSGSALVQRRGASLGDTLDGLPGVGQTWFGPGSSRPTIRGFDGERVRVLRNGAVSLDASTLSYDHAVPIDPITTERIEVLRGPAALAYGGNAIGGVVNAIDNRIPRDPVQGVGGAGELRFGGANRERSGAALLEAGNGSFAAHVDAFERRYDDLRVPRFVPVANGVAQPETDIVANSDGRARGAAVGASWNFGNGHFGASLDRYDSRYGIVVEPDVFIRMKRDEAQLAGEWRELGGGLDTLRASAVLTDYRHEEVEGSGEVGTTFTNRGSEWRAEIGHAPLGGLHGVLGVHAEDFDFSALGEEAFVPNTSTRRGALFVIEELKSAFGTTTGGLRLERARIRSSGDEDPADPRFGPAQSLGFSLLSASLAQVVPLAAGWEATASLSSTERSPTSFELFANGVHVATAAYERGDATLQPERGVNVDLAASWVGGPNQFRAGAWAARFSRYISLDPTGVGIDVPNDEGGVDTFPEYVFRSVPARFYGLELAGRSRLLDQAWQLDLTGQFDWTRATNTETGDPLPRIAPWRLVTGLEAASGAWSGRFEWLKVAARNQVAPFETPTPGSDRFNLQVAYSLRAAAANLLVFVRAENLTNELAYNAASIETVRQLAPLPGRSLKVGLRADL